MGGDMGDLIRRRDWVRTAWWAVPCNRYQLNVLMPTGYASVWRDGRKRGAHVWAWIDAFGEPTPERPWILHACDVRNCVEIRHLWDGTPSDNARDMAAKGRGKEQGKTHCPRQHPLVEGNLDPWFLEHKGWRICMICLAGRREAENARRRELRAARRRA